MNINWKARIGNKTFWVAMLGAIILLAQQLGLDISKFIPSNYVDIINSIFVILTMVGVVVDTSTKGIGDKVVTQTTEMVIQADNVAKKVQAEASTTAINSIVDVNSASSKITVDNPDNLISIGQEVNAISAAAPQ